LRTAWLDNQSGCKGTCDGLEVWKPTPADCKDGVCLDEVLLAGARRLTEGRTDDTVLFLHMLGNHGPAYSRRYPEQVAAFQPACQNADLSQCSREEIANAYDNALRYTDHVLAEAIEWLKQMQVTHDTALVYVSDHGESLGENGLYLHGLPYAIAPDVQKKVPMLMWLSAGYAERFALDTACLRTRAAEPTTHDSVFHTLLGLLDLRTAAKAPDLDLAGECRRG
jgi:lipid A ethanolaminephosphotransferase